MVGLLAVSCVEPVVLGSVGVGVSGVVGVAGAVGLAGIGASG